MNNLFLLLLTGLISTIATYIDKHLINKGISRKDYFYYTCLSIIPFSLLTIIINYFTTGLKFKINIVCILLLLLAMIIRYFKQLAVAGIGKCLDPFENLAYLSTGIIFAYIIDIIIGAKKFAFINLISIILTIIGVFLLSDIKLKNKKLQKDIIIKIIGELSLGYIAYYLLKYWSNAIYILLLNLFLTLIFCKDYIISSYKKNSQIIKWVFIQQGFGYLYIYLYNYLSSFSVTTSSYIKPVTIIFAFIFAFFYKEQKRKPKIKDFLAIILIATGVCLINR